VRRKEGLGKEGIPIVQVFDANFQINEFPTIKTKHENNEQIRV
jgi:hypothetical protein